VSEVSNKKKVLVEESDVNEWDVQGTSMGDVKEESAKKKKTKR
jgi:hypothetical protein